MFHEGPHEEGKMLRKWKFYFSSEGMEAYESSRREHEGRGRVMVGRQAYLKTAR